MQIEFDNKFNKNDALLLVDIQKDFCQGGKLEIIGGYEVVPVTNLLSLIQ